ncbi:MAG: CDP-glycerol glycerophosphotransferase family protein [Erysipelotrichaceae bacterium]|nr:CDP-glycerol glycerophosphotransferase family protein [Erysipelotrichaceae bacterium]
MTIQKIILNIVLSIEMFFVKFIPIKQNRITFISLEDDKLSSDMKLIYEKIKDKFEIKLCLILYKKSLWSQFLYFFNCMKQLYLINTSKMVILHDNNYVVSKYKKKDVFVLQLWHACGAIKKFGNVIDRTYLIKNYNAVLSTSSYWKKIYSQAFSVNEDQVLPLGLPRTDELFNQEWIDSQQKRLFDKYPELKNKKIILYAPTFRGNIYKGFHQIDFNAKKILDNLDEDYVIIYKFHPLVGNYQLSVHNRVYNMNHEDTHALFTISDMLISDYSSIIFDYMILNKPIIFYIPDYQEYKKELGVFVDIEKLNLPICNSENEISQVIIDYRSIFQIKELRNIFYEYQDGQSLKRVVDHIDDAMSNS